MDKTITISDHSDFELLKWLPATLQDTLIKGDFVERTELQGDLWRFLDILKHLNICMPKYTTPTFKTEVLCLVTYVYLF